MTFEGLAPLRQEETPAESKHWGDPVLSIPSGTLGSRLLGEIPSLRLSLKEEGAGSGIVDQTISNLGMAADAMGDGDA